MFTGIIEEKGILRDIRTHQGAMKLTVSCKAILGQLKVGDSVATNGICLTVNHCDDKGFSADVMPETLSRTTLHHLKPGDRVNLEAALTLNMPLGGHMISGHIDGLGSIIRIIPDGNAVRYTIQASDDILRYIIEKGSVAIDGISLTVTDVTMHHFSVSVIPVTLEETTLGLKRIGSQVNVECDVVGKYIEKFMGQKSGLTMDFLKEHGFA